MEVETSSDSARWEDMSKLVMRGSAFPMEQGSLATGVFEPGPETMSFIQNDCKVLVIGAGGLGCEIIKNLALSGFRHMHIIDLDRIDISNLNRQFLFRVKDVGRYKAEVAAEFVMARVPGVDVTAHTCPIQDMPTEFYKQFNVVVAGLDNLDARRWISRLLCSFVFVDEDGNVDPATVIPLLDGGTEAFKGQARLILPRITSCFECSLDAFPPQQHFQICTIAETPRKPEHCIAYVRILLWPKHFERKLDADSPEDMQWVYERALERAQQYGIEGVTYFKTIGVVKNIIPAIASTNAIVAAACANEAFKLMSFASQTLNNYFMYMGGTGLYTHTFVYSRKRGCPACGSPALTYRLDMEVVTLQQLIHRLCADTTIVHEAHLRSPSLRTASSTLFMQNPPSLRAATEKNLRRPLKELMASGEVLSVTDPVFQSATALELTVLHEPGAGVAVDSEAAHDAGGGEAAADGGDAAAGAHSEAE